MQTNFTVHVTVSIKDSNGGVANAESWNFNAPMPLGNAMALKNRIIQNAINPDSENNDKTQKSNPAG